MTNPEFAYISLYTDEDVPPKLAELLRMRGYHAASAYDVGMIARPDEQHLSYAASQGMAILVFNGQGYLLLARRWKSVRRPHAGIILSEPYANRQINDLMRCVTSFLHRTTLNQMFNRVRCLPEFKPTLPLEFFPPVGSPKSPNRR
jgi:hypothetical protein